MTVDDLLNAKGLRDEDDDEDEDADEDEAIEDDLESVGSEDGAACMNVCYEVERAQ